MHACMNYAFCFHSQWHEVQELDLSDVEDELNKRLDSIYVNDACVLVYTVNTNSCNYANEMQVFAIACNDN